MPKVFTAVNYVEFFIATEISSFNICWRRLAYLDRLNNDTFV